MTVPALEHALWRLGNVPHDVAGFRADPAAWLNEFRLDARERGWIVEFDMRRLADAGVNSMLLLAAFRSVQGYDQVPEYMRRMNTPAH